MSTVKTGVFIRDVLICSLGAYGGPQSHYGIMEYQLVKKKKYISHQELIELMSLCSILPGPTSTQTIVSVGYKIGGPRLAALTMLIWALPIVLLMGGISLVYALLPTEGTLAGLFRYIPSLALGFILLAVFRIGGKVVRNIRNGIFFLTSAILAFAFRDPWIIPGILLLAGLLENLINRLSGALGIKKKTDEKPSKERQVELQKENSGVKPHWGYLIVFLTIALAALTMNALKFHPLLSLFEAFYRYGYMVFGGGQVVVPMMLGELVEQRELMTSSEFLAGYGLVQGLPGPMFSFASFAGGMASRGNGAIFQAAGSLVSAIGIFLPGLLLIFFVYPIWSSVRKAGFIQDSIQGVNAAAGGLLLAAALSLSIQAGSDMVGIAIAGITAVLLGFTRIPPPLLVVLALAGGILV